MENKNEKKNRIKLSPLFTTGSLDNKLLGDEIQETDLYISKCKYRSMSRMC